MNDWVDAVKKEIGVDADFDIDSILAAARDAAHAVERKVAPVTTYLMGIAVAQGGDAKTIAEKIEDLAKKWPKS
jgi:hypothetical protein